MPARVSEVKCKRCRKILFTEEATPLLTGHGEVRDGSTHFRCRTGTREHILFLSLENMPDWIRDIVNNEFWVKGKIQCPHCHCRLGSFDFVSQTKCDCGEFVLPPIWIIHQRVDRYSDVGSNLPVLSMPRARYNPGGEGSVQHSRVANGN
ncbi:E3 ubiquitin-protein ligase RNF180 [Orussus abietinus]|uniref:E3 ubiquitin-protein ligase RNF180 n=1 Tax=Orussus abietinus TaxID=222816 RepID=UPI000626C3DB|nr:E3 ubiquitin-protein ligase RNF180 [Orussus abietinus]